MQDKPHVLVMLGRFQPFHLGHLSMVTRALQQAEQLIILCGSAHQPRTARNPWTTSEVIQMIRNSLSEADNQRVFITPLPDHCYNHEAWIREAQKAVKKQCQQMANEPMLGLIETQSQQPSYASTFPQWPLVAVEPLPHPGGSALRAALMALETVESNSAAAITAQVPDPVGEFILNFLSSEGFEAIKAEHQYVQDYKTAWAAAPYAPIFVTVDALVIKNGHLLVVERQGQPGKGLFALPGGFLDPQELLVDGCLRELHEETCIDLPDSELKNAIVSQHLFDAPYRSARGRTLTQVFFIKLPDAGTLPSVEGQDDAKQALWIPLAELDSRTLFEDHYSIIRSIIGL